MLFLTSFKCLLVLFLVWWISLYLCLLSYSFVPSHISSSVFAYPFCTFSVIFISVIYLNYHTLLLQCNIIIHNTFILLQGNLATQAEIHTSAQSSSKMSLPLSSTSGIWNAPTVNTFLFFFFLVIACSFQVTSHPQSLTALHRPVFSPSTRKTNYLFRGGIQTGTQHQPLLF